MKLLISTPQRCGSTWLTRMMCATMDARDLYVDGIGKGFRLGRPSEPGAVGKLARFMAQKPGIGVFKTHDVGPQDFAALCAAVPELRVLTVSRDLRDSVVSRYFYFRYYWPERYCAGTRPDYFKKFLQAAGDAPDREALRVLLGMPFANMWAREWAVFEMPLGAERALRVSYAGMLDGSELARLGEFLGREIKAGTRFEEEQAGETQQSGRQGRERFNRSGRTGEWREWWTEEEGERLLAMGREWMARMGVEVRGGE